jgi:hypothetical protein
MQTTRENNGTWMLYLGALLLIGIVTALIWNECEIYHRGALILLCAGGSAFWFIRFASTRHLTPVDIHLKSGLGESSAELCLKEFYLNGHFFHPVEQETSVGRKQFRLSSTFPMGPEREAALIRYLINEGLSEKMWPQISRRIEEEAHWAFFA